MSSVRMTIGPVPSSSVHAWAESARATLDAVRSRPQLEVPDDVAATFEAYVAMWTAIADSTEVFSWSGELDPEHLRHLAAHWAKLVTLARTDPDGTGLHPAPPEGEEFYNALVTAILEASAVDDREGFAEHFEEVVPAFDEQISHDVRPPARRRRVLLVDDNDDIRLLMRLAIERDARFEICGEAANGEEAVSQCRDRDPDAVLLDLLMPVMDGFTALPLIRDVCPEATIVVFSALDSTDTKQRVERLGATKFLGKTSDAPSVLDALAGQ